MRESSISTVLKERASFQPNDTAFTFIDYDKDWEGVPESLTWAELYRRSRNLAHELKSCTTTGDRAVILAPQGLEYIIAFLASLEAGVIAVPLSTPMAGHHDERPAAPDQRHRTHPLPARQPHAVQEGRRHRLSDGGVLSIIRRRCSSPDHQDIGLYFDGRLSNPLCLWVVRLQPKTVRA